MPVGLGIVLSPGAVSAETDVPIEIFASGSVMDGRIRSSAPPLLGAADARLFDAIKLSIGDWPPSGQNAGEGQSVAPSDFAVFRNCCSSGIGMPSCVSVST